MRNGRYTAGDIENLEIIPANKKKKTVQVATGIVNGTLIWSNGLDIVIGISINKRSYTRIEHVPYEYSKVAEIILKKAMGRGGRRLGAGKKKGNGPEKRTYSFKLTAYENMKVREFIEKMRSENSILKSNNDISIPESATFE